MIGYVNLVKGATFVYTTSNWEQFLPPTNLTGDLCSPATGAQTKPGILSGAGTLLRVTPSQAGQTWRALMLVNTNLRTVDSVTWTLKTSGGATVYTATSTGPVTGYRQIVHIAPSDQTADYLEITFSATGNPDNCINVGGVYFGPVWIPSAGISYQSSYGRKDQTDEVITQGGQEWPVARYQQRTYNLALDQVSGSEIWGNMGEVDRIARFASNILFVPDYTSAELYREAILGRLKPTSDITFPGRNSNIRSWRATVTERL
jgi:hypothetical protein